MAQVKFPEIEYNRPNIEELKSQMESLIEGFNATKDLSAQKNSIESINQLRAEFETMLSVARVRHSINTKDEKYEKEQRFSDEVYPEYSNLVNNYYKSLQQNPNKGELVQHFGRQLFDLAEKSNKTMDPKILDDLKKENLLTSEYNKLVSEALIEFEGKEYNLSGLVPFMQSEDRDLRKRAHEARWSYMASNVEQFDRIYDDLVKVRHGIAQKLGYENFVQMGYDRMQRTDYGPQDVAAFRKAVLEHIVPLSEKLWERHSKRIGIEDFKYYDQSYIFKTGNPKPKGEPQWIVEQAQKMYRELSDETGEFFDFMLEGSWMDLENKKGKSPGGYCTMFPKFGAPFIFSNFNGTSHDIDVLTHEAGHAFQVYSSRNHEVQEYFWPTAEACEIHSMSMEFFTWPWMESFFKEDTQKYKFHHLASAFTFIPYGVTIDEFQHWVYENPEATPKERRAQYSKIAAKYRPGGDAAGNKYLEEGGAWQIQSHLFHTPFYYIDYTLAQICAVQFWARMNEDKSLAWQDYLTLCKAGGSQPFLDLVKLANLKSPFEISTIQETMEKAQAYLDQVDDSHL